MKRILMRISLSQKLALIMVGMVVLTGVMTIVLTNYIVNEQARDLDSRVERIRTQAQQLRPDIKRFGPPPAATNDPQKRRTLNGPFGASETESADTIVANLKTELHNGKSADDVLTEVRDQLAYYQSPRMAFQTVYATLAATDNKETASTTFSHLILDPLRQPLAISVAILAVLAALVGLLLSLTIVRPLKALQAASARIAAGNYDMEIKPQADPDMNRLAHSFNRMAEALRNAENLRKEQIANVTHEMRTPLAAIQGYTEALRDGIVSGARKDELYERILAEIGFMTKMVASLREWSNAAARLTMLHPEPLPAFALARDVLARFDGAAAHKAVTLALFHNDQPLPPDADLAILPPRIMVDPDAFRTILGNLLDNALRYTPAGGRITTDLSTRTDTGKHGATWAVFRVTDTGEGIAAEHLAHVFERFYRVDKSRTRDTGGTGLGLALVRDAVYALGGDIAISSVVGEGTTITFRLPVATTVPNRTPTPNTALAYAQP